MKLTGIFPILFLSLVANSASALDLTDYYLSEDALTGQAIGIFIGVLGLSVFPLALILFTCFPFIVTVFSIVRQAIGLPQVPSNLIIISLSFLITCLVMKDTLSQVWRDAFLPFLDGELSLSDFISTSLAPFREFMTSRLDGRSTSDFIKSISSESGFSPDGLPNIFGLAAFFVLSEVTHAFFVGFLILLPFLVIDLVVAAFLMSMGMMMVPPAVVSLPFKIAFFLLVNGWFNISSAIISSYS